MNLINFTKYRQFSNTALFSHPTAARLKYARKASGKLKNQDLGWMHIEVGPKNAK